LILRIRIKLIKKIIGILLFILFRLGLTMGKNDRARMKTGKTILLTDLINLRIFYKVFIKKKKKNNLVNYKI